MNRRTRFLIVALLLYTGFCAVAGILVTEITLHPQRRLLDARAISDEEEVTRRTGSSLRDVSVRTKDDLTLKAWFIQPRSNNGSTVLLLHGLGDNRIGMIGYAEFLLNHDYSVLMPDARAHGQSDGAIATYGLLERQDIRDWVSWLNANLHPKCVFGLGESMGAAQLLQSVSGEPIFCAVVVESPFSDLREIAYDRVGQFFHTGDWLGRTLLRPVIEIAFLYSRWKYGFDLERVSPMAMVSASEIPMLMIHGKIDSNIPLRHSRRIKSAAPAAVLWEVPDTNHCGAIGVAPEEFERRVSSWFGTHVTALSGPTSMSSP